MSETTIKDIAKMCGVGVSTVSRAINNHPDINPDTKAMIIETIQRYGYVPNNSARNLKRTDAKCIAVLIKGISNPFFASMIKIMEAEIQKRKYTMVLHHVDHYEDEVDVALELIKEKRLRGIIFLGGYFSHSEEKLSMLQVPFILSTVGCKPEKFSEKVYSSISVDDEEESCRIVDHLIENGHKKIAIIAANNTDQSIGRLRLSGYLKAHKDHGMKVDPKLICPMKEELPSYAMSNGYAVTKELLASGEEFSAIFAISDELAIGAYSAIREIGKSIPEDYSVAGFDGLELGDYLNPTLTTIKQPVDEIAHATVNLLFDLIGGKKKNQHQVFSAELLVKESTKSIL
ncbi:MAG: LacI family DNA-binding transcriptional regulator [Lachnospiraceae bacterium]|nr:LacI family DNA-binding transcriptional regulator [Lachnospiraceae bacterium]